MRMLLCAAAVALLGVAVGRAETIRLKLEGVKCDQCADVINEAIGKVPTAKVKTTATKAVPAAVVDVDLKKSDIGAIGKAVAEAETPHKEVEAPAAFLILKAPGLTATNAKTLDKALKGVKGVNGVLSEADVKGKEVRIKLSESGDAKIADIQKALAAYLK